MIQSILLYNENNRVSIFSGTQKFKLKEYLSMSNDILQTEENLNTEENKKTETDEAEANTELTNETNTDENLNTNESEEEETDDMELDYEYLVQPASSSKIFVKSSEKYEDLHSSGITLIFVGLIGIAFLICQKLGFIPIGFDDVMQWVFIIAMGALFLAFIIVGILSLKNAKKIKDNIAEEEAFDKQILHFIKDQYTSETLDKAVFSEDEEEQTEELMYFKRVEWLKNTLTNEFGEMDDSYLEHAVENIYQTLYEED